MKNVFTAGAALLLSTSIVSAGGLDRSGQSIAPIFEAGTYVELSYGYVTPSVSGEVTGAGIESGNVGVSYGQFSAAVKSDLNEQVSYTIIFDQPYGADVDYSDAEAGYPILGTNAQFRSTGISVLGRYQLDENVSFHGGLRAVTIEADVEVGAYVAEYDSDTQFAFVLGAAYEVPEIALRVALTYTSAMDFEHSTTVGGADVVDTEYEIPQSVNLDFQTGVAADTLLFGSVRWVEWTQTEVNSFGYPANPLVSYDNDSFTYNVGVGRRFSNEFSGSISFGYEKANGGEADNLAPTDGNRSIGLGGAYTLANGVEISGGVRYIVVGDAETSFATFEDNSATAVGLKVAYTY